MSHWVKGEDDAENGQDRRSRILYWWPPLVSSDNSADVGRRMLKGTIVWLVVFIAAVILIGVLVDVTG